jgi:hypothetical protein
VGKWYTDSTNSTPSHSSQRSGVSTAANTVEAVR